MFEKLNQRIFKAERKAVTLLLSVMITVIFSEIVYRTTYTDFNALANSFLGISLPKIILIAFGLTLVGFLIHQKTKAALVSSLSLIIFNLILLGGSAFLSKDSESAQIIWSVTWLLLSFEVFSIFFLIADKTLNYRKALKKGLIAAICLASFAILLRFGFKSGIPWAQKLALSLFLWSAFIGASQATYKKQMLRVEAFSKLIPEDTKSLYQAFSDFVTLVFCLFFAIVAFEQVQINFNYWTESNYTDQVFNVMPWLPFWVVNSIIPYGFLMVGLRSFGPSSYTLFKENPRHFKVLLILSSVFISLFYMLISSYDIVQFSGVLIVAITIMTVFLGAPIFVVLGVLAFFCTFFIQEGREIDSYLIYIDKIFSLTTKNVLLAIPFFVVSGAIMTHGSMARKLIDFAISLTKKIPGGLAMATIFACVFFAALSGSSPVTVIAIGSIMVPALINAGYSEKFSMGLATSCGSLGILIPPSIPMIVYAIVGSSLAPVSISDLFIGGVLPGALIAGLMALYSAFYFKRSAKLSLDNVDFSLSEVTEKLRQGIFSLLLPLLILGGIYQGFYTATEAACVACVYALFVEFFLHKDLTFKGLEETMNESNIMLGSLILIMVIAFGFNDFLVEQEVPNMMIEKIAAAGITSPIVFLLIINLLLLLVGLFMDIMSAILILVPLILPIALTFGFDPLHLGIMIIVNLEVGYLTPPIGINLFVAASLWKKSLGEITSSILPFIAIMLLGLMLVAFIPGISTGLVNLKNDREFFQPLVKDEANIEKSLFKKFEEETLDEIEDEEEAMGDLMKGLMDEEGLLDDASEEEDTESEADADSDGDMEALMKEIPLVDEEENENE